MREDFRTRFLAPVEWADSQGFEPILVTDDSESLVLHSTTRWQHDFRRLIVWGLATVEREPQATEVNRQLASSLVIVG